MNTHGLEVDFGRHKGTPYTKVPVSYLLWMVNCDHSRKEYAEAELERRGTVLPDLEVSGHAIDRASLHCRKIWYRTQKENEGLHAWLVRMTREAIDKNNVDDKGRYHHNGMRFVIENGEIWPFLKTVMRESEPAG